MGKKQWPKEGGEEEEGDGGKLRGPVLGNHLDRGRGREGGQDEGGRNWELIVLKRDHLEVGLKAPCSLTVNVQLLLIVKLTSEKVKVKIIEDFLRL